MASHESIDTDAFRLGTAYSRVEIAQAGRVAEPVSSRDPHWAKGIVPFSNAVLLLVTLDKRGRADYAYEDRFEGSVFWWQSQNEQTPQSPVVRRIIAGEVPVLLFARIAEKRKGKTCSFVYCGRVGAPIFEGERPVTFLFESLDFAAQADGELKAVYDWKPGALPAPPEVIREEAVRRRARSRAGGQGRESDPRVRKAVEMRAMHAARVHYEGQGYSLTDTSLTRPYDYVASKPGDDRRVEVKGAQGGGASVTVTAGEVSAALEGPESTDLFVLSEIDVTARDGEIVATGGSQRVIVGWRPAPKDLAPTEYRYNLPVE